MVYKFSFFKRNFSKFVFKFRLFGMLKFTSNKIFGEKGYYVLWNFYDLFGWKDVKNNVYF